MKIFLVPILNDVADEDLTGSEFSLMMLQSLLYLNEDHLAPHIK